jgi:hypothetical protein
MPDVPVEESSANPGDDLPLLPMKSLNVARKRAMKKLKVSKDTRPEVGAATAVVEYPISSLLLTTYVIVAGNPLPGTSYP